jgi:hypothetical protein
MPLAETAAGSPPSARATPALPRHLLLAFAVAPVVALLVLTAAVAVSLAIETGATAIVVRDLPWSTFYVLIVGLPVAYALELLVGIPLYRRRDRALRMRRWHVVAIATLVGTVAMPIGWAMLVPGQVVWLMSAYGALTGLVAGATFVVIAAPEWAQPPRG